MKYENPFSYDDTFYTTHRDMHIYCYYNYKNTKKVNQNISKYFVHVKMWKNTK